MNSDLNDHYFGTGRENTTGPICNACGADIGTQGHRRDLHIQFHEQLQSGASQTNLPRKGNWQLPPERLTNRSEGIWVLKSEEFNAELSKAWQAGYEMGLDRTIDAAPNPYGDPE